MSPQSNYRASRASISSVHPEETNLRPRSDGPNEIKPVYLDEISSSVDENTGREDGLLDCGVIPSNCLPCLAVTVPVEKRRSSSSSPPSVRKKSTHKLSFKWKYGHPNANICSSTIRKLNPCFTQLGRFNGGNDCVFLNKILLPIVSFFTK
ncbi:hypothetical protein L2E82_06249 [Cichorium intybus]|uniref:Uncharacterized protein n=1 Tax=Cichorium intybus TaxID=13427 RepID=A0ACB9HBQ5_CICIN|nr:hypothetical protein L2E82_06249 [Cichorium intybus]